MRHVIADLQSLILHIVVDFIDTHSCNMNVSVLRRCTYTVCIVYLHENVFFLSVCVLVCVCPPQSRKGRSCSSQREVTVVLPNGQYVVVRCDIKSRARDVFDMVVAHANLVEHFYFSLAFLDGKEKQDPAYPHPDCTSTCERERGEIAQLLKHGFFISQRTDVFSLFCR